MVFIPPREFAVRPDGVSDGELLGVLGVCHSPACKRSRCFFDVFLGVVSDSKGEQFQKLSTVIFVYRAIVVVNIVQPDDHGRVLGKLQQ